jgi:hypothetical protein
VKFSDRNCGNCANFTPNPAPGQPVCWTAEVTNADDLCHHHITQAESDDEDATLESAARMVGPWFAADKAEALSVARVAIRQAAYCKGGSL